MQNLDESKTVNAWSSLADTVFVPTRKLNTTDWFPCSIGWSMKLVKTNPPLRLWRLLAYSSKSMKTSTFRSCPQNSWAAHQYCRFNPVEKPSHQPKLKRS
jgi:hypothetical protein